MRAPSNVHAGVALALVCGLALGCDDASRATDAATQAATRAAADAAKQASDRTQAAALAAGKQVGDATQQAVDRTRAATARTWADLTDTGELSSRTTQWLRESAASTDMRAIAAKGEQIAPVALEIGRTINAAVDSDIAIEPIYQALDGRDPAEVDQAIAAMPRVEIVDGLKIGFAELSRSDAGTSVSESAYLVTWRRGDRLVGLVYRSKRTIDIDALIAQTPRLVALTQAALATATP